MPRLSMTLCVLLLGSGWSAPAWGYTAFDEVVEVAPTWTALPVTVLVDSVAYRLRVLAPDRIAIDLRNRSTGPVVALVDLPAYQASPRPTQIQAPSGTTTTVEIPVTRADRACTEAAVRFLRLDINGMPVRTRRFPAPGPVPDRAYALATTWESAGFRPSAVAYAVRQEGPQFLDVRLLNRSAQPIHGDIALPGWQTPGTVLPRVHLLPGVFTDVLIPTPSPQPRVGAAALAMWAVRVGDDTGPSLGRGPEDATALPPLPEPAEDWQTAGLGDAGLAGFNPRVVSYRFVADGVEVHGRNEQPLTARMAVLGGPTPLSLAVTLAAGATVRLPLPPDHGPGLILYDLSLGGQPIQPEPLTIAPAPANALPVAPLVADARFNPLTLLAQVTVQGEHQAQVHLANRSAIAWHGDIALPAYQSTAQIAGNARVHLAAGAALRVVLTIGAPDVRLPLAQVVVRNVRLGEDAGAVWCAP